MFVDAGSAGVLTERCLTNHLLYRFLGVSKVLLSS